MEGGGFKIQIAGKSFFTVQVAEKGVCWVRALLGKTTSPTVLRAGNKTNVIPGLAEAEIDGRILPGQSQDDFLRELGDVLGQDIELEVMHSLPPTLRFADMFHGHDERIPVEGLAWGTQTLMEVIRRCIGT